MTSGASDEVESQRAVGLDDCLLRRILQERMFGRSQPVIVGRYEVLERIGRGGMGTVYRARDPELSRTIALKLIRPDRQASQWRMLNEARALARLSHPNVVTVHEVGMHDDRVFLAMEYVEGQTLREWLESSRRQDDLLSVLAQAARGLAAAHAAGLVHRDFKPENVLIGVDGRVRVVDFGVAKARDEPRVETQRDDAPVEQTATGRLLGTPAYMAAEQFVGDDVDARADVFSLSVVIYEALSTERPFTGNTVDAVARAVLSGKVAPLRANGLPPGLADLVRRGLSPNPSVRPGLVALIDALEPRPMKSRRWIVALAVGAALGAGVLAAAAESTGELDTDERVVFAEIGRAVDDDERRAAAETYLASFGAAGDPVLRAIAHATLGETLWQRSCEDPWMDLCLREEPVVPGPCLTPDRGTIIRTNRDSALIDAAQEHFRAAVELAGVHSPEDEALAAEFGHALGMAKTRLTDAELEVYLSRRVSEAFDFEYAEQQSQQFFREELNRRIQEIHRQANAYRSAAAYSRLWSVVGVSRVGMLYESLAIMIADVPAPLSVAPDEMCATVQAFYQEAASRSPWQDCVDRAKLWGLEALPEVEYCADRVSR